MAVGKDVDYPRYTPWFVFMAVLVMSVLALLLSRVEFIKEEGENRWRWIPSAVSSAHLLRLGLQSTVGFTSLMHLTLERYHTSMFPSLWSRYGKPRSLTFFTYTVVNLGPWVEHRPTAKILQALLPWVRYTWNDTIRNIVHVSFWSMVLQPRHFQVHVFYYGLCPGWSIDNHQFLSLGSIHLNNTILPCKLGSKPRNVLTYILRLTTSFLKALLSLVLAMTSIKAQLIWAFQTFWEFRVTTFWMWVHCAPFEGQENLQVGIEMSPSQSFNTDLSITWIWAQPIIPNFHHGTPEVGLVNVDVI
jgi:hypothetical protein